LNRRILTAKRLENLQELKKIVVLQDVRRLQKAKGDILNVLSNFLDEIPLYLEIGMSI
jgi:hypothetical protein